MFISYQLLRYSNDCQICPQRIGAPHSYRFLQTQRLNPNGNILLLLFYHIAPYIISLCSSPTATSFTPTIVSNSSSWHKRCYASNLPSQYQRMDVICAFVRIHSFQIIHMSNDVVLITDSISTQHISSHPCNI